MLCCVCPFQSRCDRDMITYEYKYSFLGIKFGRYAKVSKVEWCSDPFVTMQEMKGNKRRIIL